MTIALPRALHKNICWSSTSHNNNCMMVSVHIDKDPSQKEIEPKDCLASLGQVFTFCKLVHKLEDDEKRTDPVVVCPNTDERLSTTASAFLIGAYLILCKQHTNQEVMSKMSEDEKMMPALKEDEELLASAWGALHHARDLGWIDLITENTDPTKTIDVEEYMHYDSPANGRLHVVVPSKLIVFPCPVDLGTDPSSGEPRQWLDQCGKRQFSAHYYASVLSEMDVCLALGCHGEREGGYDEGAFCERGMATERVRVDQQAKPGSILRAVDRFLTLARATPEGGVIAMHGGGEGLANGGEVLVTSLLISLYGFGAGAALAWLGLAHPPAAHAGLRFSVRKVAGGGGGARRVDLGRRFRLVDRATIVAAEEAWDDVRAEGPPLPSAL